jgi:hypothetical protein
VADWSYARDMNRGRGPGQGDTYDTAGGQRRDSSPGHVGRRRAGQHLTAGETVTAGEAEKYHQEKQKEEK